MAQEGSGKILVAIQISSGFQIILDCLTIMR